MHDRANLSTHTPRTCRWIPAVLLSLFFWTAMGAAQVDPGPRPGAAGAGGPLKGLPANQLNNFNLGQIIFNQTASVKATVSGTRIGLGPRFNGESCMSCHSQPAVGGTSPSVNPEFAAATDQGATNTIPSFITPNGPAREARFVHLADGVTPDGGVQDLFTITGRSDAGLCNIAQPDFTSNLAKNNVIFRIPTPVFGTGLIEEIPDSTVLANMQSNLALKQSLGIGGIPNTTPNGGTISKFGWKSQNPSMIVFAAEASNVELGITNEMLTQERDETPGCVLNSTPEDHLNFAAKTP